MREHHAKALEQAKARLLEQEPDTLAIILGGSIARGIDRDESDVDVIVVIPEERYLKRVAGYCVSFLWYDIPGYEGRLVEGRFVPKAFITEAATRGSEPTRNSFTGARAVYCIDPEIPEILPLIPVYPEHRRKENMAAFFSQMQCNRGFFWDQGKHNPYLKIRSASDIVLFGCRLILAHNRILFPGQRRMLEFTLAAPDKPEKLGEKINAFLTNLTDETKEEFCRTIEAFAPWENVDRYILDVEMSWFAGDNGISEW